MCTRPVAVAVAPLTRVKEVTAPAVAVVRVALPEARVSQVSDLLVARATVLARVVAAAAVLVLSGLLVLERAVAMEETASSRLLLALPSTTVAVVVGLGVVLLARVALAVAGRLLQHQATPAIPILVVVAEEDTGLGPLAVAALSLFAPSSAAALLV